MDDLSKECAFLLTSIILLDKSVRPILFQDSWIFIGDFSAFSFLHLLDSASWTIIYENFIIYLSVHLKYLIELSKNLYSFLKNSISLLQQRKTKRLRFVVCAVH